MNKRISILAVLAATLCGLSSQGQPVRSGYFLPGMFNRTKINPAVINRTGYVGIPFISDISVGAALNAGVANFIFPYPSGGLTTFMNSSVSASEFLSKLSPVNGGNVDLSLDIFSMGYFSGNSYQTIGLSLRSMSSATIPYALFDFMKSGMTAPSTHYMIKDLGFQTQNFFELSWSYARPINSQWNVGGRAKVLMGLAYADARIAQMDVEMSADKWQVTSQGQMSASAIVPISYNVNSEGAVSGLNTNMSKIGPRSFGFSLDLGATYKPDDRWTVSLSATDVGLIFWDETSDARTRTTPFIFNGFSDIPIGGGGSIQGQLNELKKQAQELFAFYPTAPKGSRAQWLKATINVAGEFEVFEDLFSVGVLSSTRIDPVYTITDLIVSANYRPTDGWFNASLTGDFSNVAVSCGAVINFCPKFLNFFVGLDYMLWNVSPQFIPLSAFAPRVSFGLSVPLGSSDKYYKNRR